MGEPVRDASPTAVSRVQAESLPQLGKSGERTALDIKKVRGREDLKAIGDMAGRATRP